MSSLTNALMQCKWIKLSFRIFQSRYASILTYCPALGKSVQSFGCFTLLWTATANCSCLLSHLPLIWLTWLLNRYYAPVHLTKHPSLRPYPYPTISLAMLATHWQWGQSEQVRTHNCLTEKLRLFNCAKKALSDM